MPISAIVLTRNEEANLSGCLTTLTWADEMLVVDSFSTDATQTIAEQMNARFIQHPFTGFASQRNFAQSIAAYDWVFFVDADERVTPELRDEILDLMKSGNIDRFSVYHVQRCNLFSGHWQPDPKRLKKMDDKQRQLVREREMARLLNRRTPHWERELHEVVVTEGPRGVLERGILLHYSNTNLHAWIEPLNDYTSREAAVLNKTRTRRVPIIEAIFRAVRLGFYVYFRYGWLKGGEIGLTMTIINVFTKFLNYVKLDERIRITQGEGVWTDHDRAILDRFR